MKLKKFCSVVEGEPHLLNLPIVFSFVCLSVVRAVIAIFVMQFYKLF